MNNVGLNESSDMQKELYRNVDKTLRFKQKTAKISLDPEFDPEG